MKTIRKKKCKICNSQFKPYLSTQRVCSNKCAVAFAKDKLEKQKTDLDKATKEYKEGQNLSSILAQTKKIVHEFIRKRDINKNCISCNAPYNTSFDAGHFYPAGKFTALKFDLDNINGQCQQCNRYNEGEFEKYSLRLPNRIGKQNYDNLIKRAKTSIKYAKKWTRTELKAIQKDVKQKIKDL